MSQTCPQLFRRFLGCLVALMALACLEVEESLFDPIDDVPPVILESFPADGQENVSVGSDIRVWFSEPVDPFSITLRTVVLYSGEEQTLGAMSIQAEDDGRGLVIFHPDRELVPGVRYNLKLTRGITDLYGNPLPEQILVQFYTAAS